MNGRKFGVPENLLCQTKYFSQLELASQFSLTRV